VRRGSAPLAAVICDSRGERIHVGITEPSRIGRLLVVNAQSFAKINEVIAAAHDGYLDNER
jgi:hypothetical protein